MRLVHFIIIPADNIVCAFYMSLPFTKIYLRLYLSKRSTEELKKKEVIVDVMDVIRTFIVGLQTYSTLHLMNVLQDKC